MRSSNGFKKLVYCFSPLLLFILISGSVQALMEAVWFYRLEDWVLKGADTAYFYAVQAVRDSLFLVIPAGTGALCIRREAAREIRSFADRRAGRPWSAKSMPVLAASAAALSLGCSTGLTLLADQSGVRGGMDGFAGGRVLPGFSGILLQAVVYILFMPLLEEMVFRGLTFARLEALCGLRRAALLSGILFGVYHASLLQGIYAALMGMVFAFAYARTARFAVPYALHGICNLFALCLHWNGLFETVCSPGWITVFFSVAAMGFYTLYRIEHAGK